MVAGSSPLLVYHLSPVFLLISNRALATYITYGDILYCGNDPDYCSDDSSSLVSQQTAGTTITTPTSFLYTGSTWTTDASLPFNSNSDASAHPTPTRAAMPTSPKTTQPSSTTAESGPFSTSQHSGAQITLPTGVAIGVVFGLALIGTTLGFLLWRPLKPKPDETTRTPFSAHGMEEFLALGTMSRSAELSGNSARTELPGVHQAHELPGGRSSEREITHC